MKIDHTCILTIFFSIFVTFSSFSAITKKESSHTLISAAQLEELQSSLSDCQCDLEMTHSLNEQLITMSHIYDEQIEKLSILRNQQTQHIQRLKMELAPSKELKAMISDQKERIQKLETIATKYKTKTEQLKYKNDMLHTSVAEINSLVKQLIELLGKSGVYTALNTLELSSTRSSSRSKTKSGIIIKRQIDALYQEIAEAVLNTYDPSAPTESNILP